MSSTQAISMNLSLFESHAKDTEQLCVKCGKPQEFPLDVKLFRCPHCNEFFKPHAELIFLLDEELHTLLRKRPGQIFFKYPLFKKICLFLLLVTLLLGGLIWKAISAIGLVALFFYNQYMLHNPVIDKIRELERVVWELEAEYQKEASMEESA